MSSLVKYAGSEVTLPDEFNEFSGFAGIESKKFNFDGQGNLKIDVGCPVAIVQSSANTIAVAIEADPEDLKNFTVTQNGDQISVVEKKSSGSNFSGNVVITGNGGSISMSGGRVFVNGQRVDAGGSGRTSTRQPRILIAAPANSNLDATLAGQAILASMVPHDEAFLNLSGQIKAAVGAKSVEIEISGQGTAKTAVMGGELRAGVSGQGKIDARGEFARISTNLSGMGSIVTRGNVAKGYSAQASGMGSITHVGQISGPVRQNASGMASINLG